MKQAMRAQQQAEQVQAEMAERTVESTSGGGEVKFKIGNVNVQMNADIEINIDTKKLATELVKFKGKIAGVSDNYISTAKPVAR